MAERLTQGQPESAPLAHEELLRELIEAQRKLVARTRPTCHFDELELIDVNARIIFALSAASPAQKAKVYERVVDESPTLGRVDPDEVAAALGAEPVPLAHEDIIGGCINCGEPAATGGGYEIGNEDEGVAGPFCSSCYEDIVSMCSREYEGRIGALDDMCRDLEARLAAQPPPETPQGEEASRVLVLLEKAHDVVFSARNDAANDAADLYEHQDYEPAKRLSAVAMQLEPAVDALESALALLRASQPPPEELRAHPSSLPHSVVSDGRVVRCDDCGVSASLGTPEASRLWDHTPEDRRSVIVTTTPTHA